MYGVGAEGKDLMNEETVEFLFPYVDLGTEEGGEYFTPKVAKSASSAAEGLCIFAAATTSAASVSAWRSCWIPANPSKAFSIRDFSCMSLRAASASDQISGLPVCSVRSASAAVLPSMSKMPPKLGDANAEIGEALL